MGKPTIWLADLIQSTVGAGFTLFSPEVYNNEVAPLYQVYFMAGPDRPTSDVVEQQSTPDLSTEVSPSVVADSTAQPGQGATEFQNIATQTQAMVNRGDLPNTTVNLQGGDSSQAPDRQGQVDRLRQTIGDRSLFEGIGDRDAFASNVVDTANKIASLPPGSPEIQNVLDSAVSDFRKSNPEAANFAFSGALHDALQDRPGGAPNLISAYTNDTVILRDRTQVTDSNPSGLVGTAFSGDTSTAEGQQAKAAFDTARQLAQLGRPVDFNSGILGELKSNGVLAGVPDLPARQRPEGAPSQDQLVAQMLQNHRGIPESAIRGALNLADNLAFETSGGKLGEQFSKSVDALAASNPNLDKGQLARLMTGSLNAVTQSKEFGLSILGSDVNMAFIRDQRLATPANKFGTAGALLESADDMPAAQQQFNEAMQVNTVLQEGRARLPGNISKENFQTFLLDTQGNLGSFRSDVIR